MAKGVTKYYDKQTRQWVAVGAAFIPKVGQDYFTAQDRTEIAQDVVNNLPDGDKLIFGKGVKF